MVTPSLPLCTTGNLTKQEVTTQLPLNLKQSSSLTIGGTHSQNLLLLPCFCKNLTKEVCYLLNPVAYGECLFTSSYFTLQNWNTLMFAFLYCKINTANLLWMCIYYISFDWCSWWATRSSEHYASFLLAPAEGWKPFYPIMLLLEAYVSKHIIYLFIYQGSI